MQEYVPFKGKLKLFRLKSEISSYFMPINGKEVEQHLTIRKDGRVWLNRYGFSYPYNPRYEKRKTEYYKIAKESVDKIFELVSAFFEKGYYPQFSCDVGVWDVELINTENNSFCYIGDHIGDYIINNVDICKVIREELNLPDLLLFDGNAKEEYISRIEANFYLNNSIERLSIDHKNGELILKSEKSDDVKTSISVINHNYIRQYLEDTRFFEDLNISECREDKSIRPKNYQRKYDMVITSNKGNIRKQEGFYDTMGLPYDWDKLIDFIEELFSANHNIFSFLKPKIFERKFPNEGELTYCLIKFSNNGREYYYICDFDEVEEGDFVIVPVGANNKEVVGRVSKIEFYTKDNVPHPLDKIKHIIEVIKEGELIPQKLRNYELDCDYDLSIFTIKE